MKIRRYPHHHRPLHETRVSHQLGSRAFSLADRVRDGALVRIVTIQVLRLRQEDHPAFTAEVRRFRRPPKTPSVSGTSTAAHATA